MTSAESDPTRPLAPLENHLHLSKQSGQLTVNALPVPLHFPVEDCVLVLGQHLLLSRHLQLPAIHLLHAQPCPRQRIVECRNNTVYVSKALALSVLLVAGQTPGNFPVEALVSWLIAAVAAGSQPGTSGVAHQSKPPESGFVRRKGPNIVDVRVRVAVGRAIEDAN